MDTAAPTVATALAEARARGLDRLDAQLLLGHVLGRPRTWLLAHDDEPVEATASAAWDRLASRRAAGEPLAYLVGHKEFRGLSLAVDARVLIPRPETEVLVDWALEILVAHAETQAMAAPAARLPARVVDLGTGSGAIAVAIAAAGHEHALPSRVHASDVSLDALAVARANAARHPAGIELRDGSWWSPWQGCRFDLAVSNPPYIAVGDAHLANLRHEPAGALVAGDDGLDAIRALITPAGDHLAPGGWLLVEHGWDQAERVQRLMRDAGLLDVRTRRDLAGRDRCTGGRVAGRDPSSGGAPGA